MFRPTGQPTIRRHAWVRHYNLFHDLETNPYTQLKVHTYAQRFWMINVPIVFYMMVFQPRLWLIWGLFLTTIYSLYANWTSDNNAAISTRALLNTTPPNSQLEAEILHKFDV